MANWQSAWQCLSNSSIQWPPMRPIPPPPRPMLPLIHSRSRPSISGPVPASGRMSVLPALPYFPRNVGATIPCSQTSRSSSVSRDLNTPFMAPPSSPTSPTASTSERKRGLNVLEEVAARLLEEVSPPYASVEISRVFQVLSSDESSSTCLLRDCVVRTFHPLSECDSFRSLTIHQRWCFCSYFSICAVCLSASHGTDVHSCFYFYPFSEHLCLCSASSDHCSLMCPSPSVKPPFSCSMNSPDCDCNFVQLSTWWTCSFKQCTELFFHKPHSCVWLAKCKPSLRLEYILSNGLCRLCLKPGHLDTHCNESYPATIYQCACPDLPIHHIFAHPHPADLSPPLSSGCADDDDGSTSCLQVDLPSFSVHQNILHVETEILSFLNDSDDDDDDDDDGGYTFLLSTLLQEPEKRMRLDATDGGSLPEIPPEPASRPDVALADCPNNPDAAKTCSETIVAVPSADPLEIIIEPGIQSPRRDCMFMPPPQPVDGLIAQPTLHFRRLSMSLQFVNEDLMNVVRYPHPFLRNCIAVLNLCPAAVIYLVLNHVHTHPVQLLSGLNILTFSPFNLSVDSTGIGGYSTFPCPPDFRTQMVPDPSLSFYLRGDVQLVDTHGQPVVDPVSSGYSMGSRPAVINILRPLVGRDQQIPEDRRSQRWYMSVLRGEWPLQCPTVFLDLFVEPRLTHISDWQQFTEWPLLTCPTY